MEIEAAPHVDDEKACGAVFSEDRSGYLPYIREIFPKAFRVTGFLILTTLALRQLTPNKKRTKISLIIIRINILTTLKKTHHPIRKRSSNHLIYNLENPLGENCLKHQ